MQTTNCQAQAITDGIEGGSSGSDVSSRVDLSASKPHSRLRLRFDGSSRSNPGPAGCGYVLSLAAAATETAEEVVEKGGQHLGVVTNNEAEYYGLITGCRRALALGYRSLIIEGDSLLVCQQVLGHWQVRSTRLATLHHAALGLINSFDSVEVRHIPRASNDAADRLARHYSDRVDLSTSKPPLAARSTL